MAGRLAARSALVFCSQFVVRNQQEEQGSCLAVNSPAHSEFACVRPLVPGARAAPASRRLTAAALMPPSASGSRALVGGLRPYRLKS